MPSPETPSGFEIGAGDTYIIYDPDSETLDLFINGDRATPAEFSAYVTTLRDERDALAAKLATHCPLAPDGCSLCGGKV